jgi:glycine dehydrogenase
MLMSALKPLGDLENTSEFVARHIGPFEGDERLMLDVIAPSQPNFTRRALIEAIVPRSIARAMPMKLPAPLSEAQALAELKALASHNRLLKSFIGQGYHGTFTPGVILVHGLHPLPGRDQPGPDGSAGQLPDHGLRPHRHGHRQRQHAR